MKQLRMSTASKLVELKPFLTSLVRDNKSASAVMLSLAVRERSRKSLDLKGFRAKLAREGFKVNTHDFYECFDKLASVGLGDLKERRFFWRYNMIEVGKVSLAETPRQKPLPGFSDGAITHYSRPAAPTTAHWVQKSSGGLFKRVMEWFKNIWNRQPEVVF